MKKLLLSATLFLSLGLVGCMEHGYEEKRVEERPLIEKETLTRTHIGRMKVGAVCERQLNNIDYSDLPYKKSDVSSSRLDYEIVSLDGGRGVVKPVCDYTFRVYPIGFLFHRIEEYSHRIELEEIKVEAKYNSLNRISSVYVVGD